MNACTAMAHRFGMDTALIALFTSLISLAGAELLIPVQVVPGGIESVNGSEVNMGCTSPLVDRGGVMVCESMSHLVDGCSPDIDTNTSDWAAQLVTVKESDSTAGFQFSHVLLTFGFDTVVSLTGVELDLFLCSEWNIGASFIDVYGYDNNDLVLQSPESTNFFASRSVSETSCDSLTTVSISPTPDHIGDSHHTWHIVVDVGQRDGKWLHVGEVRLLGMPGPSICSAASSSRGSSSSVISTAGPIPSTVVTSSVVTPTPTKPSTPPNTTYTYSTTPNITATTTSESVMATATVTTTATSTSLMPSSSTVVPAPSFATDPPPDGLPQLVFIAGIGGAGLLSFHIIGVCVCCMICRRSRVQHKAVQDNLTKEQEVFAVGDHCNGNLQTLSLNSDSLEAGNGNHLSANLLRSLVDNPVYNTIDETPQSIALYETIPAEVSTPVKVNACKDSPAETTSTQTTTISDANGVEWKGIYDVATSPTSDESALIPKEKPSEHCAKPKGPGTADNLDLYIDMMTPAAPPACVSPDLEQLLTRRATVNEGIYSERINLSDFTHGSSRESEIEQEIKFYGPVYSQTVLPPSFRSAIEVSSENFKETKQLRIGHFGETVLASTNDLSLKYMRLSTTNNDPNISITVAVKKLQPSPSQFQSAKEAFNKEAKFVSELQHPNVLRLLGVCYHDPAFIMMEYMEEGDLNQFLQRYTEVVPIVTPSSNTQITTSTLVYMAYQIANAMQYLSGFKFVHRDLATRNCFIGTNTIVKIADLGVDINRYHSHYYPIRDSTLLPIRWMATECFSGKFSEKSDVWAFGVTIWELFTLAKEMPYPHVSDDEVIQNALKRDYRLLPLRSAACPEPLYEVMKQCWILDSKQRATFVDLYKMLQMHL